MLTLHLTITTRLVLVRSHDLNICIVSDQYQTETEYTRRAKERASCAGGELGEDGVGSNEGYQVVDCHLHLSSRPEIVDEEQLPR